jgi:microcin C transport system substrate-binding protein
MIFLSLNIKLIGANMPLKKYIVYLFILLIFAVISTNCNRSQKPQKKFNTEPISIKQFNIPPGADPSVSAEMGGAGFKGEGWQSNENYNTIGDPKSVKGGSLIMSLNEFPVTLRTIGQNTNSYFRVILERMLYETLLGLDPVTQDYTPFLATHWKISDDKQEFKFRLNPDARWADGNPVTSEDVIATWKLYTDPEIIDPTMNEIFSRYEQPIAESKYIFSIKSKILEFQQFWFFSLAFKVLPAHYINNISGKEFLEKYQFKFIPGSGSYIVEEKDISKGQSIMFRRRSDYWAESMKFNKGLNNFDLIRFDVVQDPTLELEKFKKGEIDVLSIRSSSTWNDKLNFDDMKRGLMAKKRVFNETPGQLQGIVFNTRKAPFDDIRIRKAFIYLFDREKFNQKFFYNSYTMIYSFFPGSVYANPSNPVLKYNIDSAVALLKDAGWTEKNSRGYLVKNGKEFSVELPFIKGSDKYLTVFQEDLKKVGIKLDLKELDFQTIMKLGNERNFLMLPVGWENLLVPNPDVSMSSESADQIGTSNWDGMKDLKIDELIKKYAITFDKNERIKIIREIDFIATNKFDYILQWYPDCQRIAFQNKFGYPECILERTENFKSIMNLWYNDPEKAAEYDLAFQDKNKTLVTGEVDNKYWLQIKEKEEQKRKN